MGSSTISMGLPSRLRKLWRRSRFSARGRWFSSWVVGLDAGEDFVFGDEAGDVVDVAMRVVAGAAFVEPEDFFYA